LSGTDDRLKPKTLEQAYALIERRYREEDLRPGTVRLIGLKQAWNAVVATEGQCGVAMGFTGQHAVYGEDAARVPIEAARACVGRSLLDVARELAGSPGIPDRSLALAAMNALSQPFITEERLKAEGYTVGIELEDIIRKDDVVALVGYGGMVKRLVGMCRELHVTDIRPREALQTIVVGREITYEPHDIFVHGAGENEHVLAEADVALITASTLVNETLREVVGYCGNCRAVGLYGPSGMLLPDALFREGIDFVQSISIPNTQRFERDVIENPDMESALKNNQRRYTVCRPR
jgi:uncharacterized protein (DUF4213/DUF364 family)